MDSEVTPPPAAASFRPGKTTVYFTLGGLVALCTSLVAVTALLTHLLQAQQRPPSIGQPIAIGAQSAPIPPPAAGPEQPWGDLVTLDIDIEQPEEYVSLETTTPPPTAWVFAGTTRAQARTLMTQCGFSPAQLEQAFAEGRVEDTSSATIVRPTAELVLALTPEVRSKFYTQLAQWAENSRMSTPYHLGGESIETLFVKSEVDPAISALVHQLSYTRNGKRYFSDPELVLKQIPTPEGRLHLLKALTYQTAVLARLRLGSNSDIDKILGYWGSVPGVRAKDLRPLLESIKKTPEGGTISLLYLLPRFARERLYTFPMPTQAGDVKMDCHWTALNFFNDEPDDRLQDNAYASAFIKEHFYQIGKPSMCGDLVFLTNPKGEVIHSAVYIAADICFTKNGINPGQPWVLMRLPDPLPTLLRPRQTGAHPLPPPQGVGGRLKRLKPPAAT